MSEHDSSWASGAPDDRAAGQSPRNQHEQQDTTNEWSAPSSPESATTPSSPPGATPYQGGTYQPGQTSSFPSYQGSGYGNPPPEPSAAPTSAPGAPGAGHPGSSYTGGPVWPGATSGYPGSAAGGYPAPVGHGGEPKPGIGRLGRIAVLGLAALFLALCSGLTGGFIARSTDDPRPATTITRNAAPALERSSVAAVAAKVQPSVVDINTGSGEGSGVVLSADGAILTNNHVVEGARGNTVDVTLSDGKTAKATIVGTDPKGDLAVIKAQNVSGLKPATFGDSDAMQVGDAVLALGSPLGLQGSVTAGIVSAVGRTIDEGGPNNSGASIGNAIQTDAAINPGNSGGALVNLAGEVIGINTAIATAGQASGNIGVGFAIASNTAKSTADQLLKGGKVSHPYLGVQVSNGEGGAIVAEVVPGGPADKAGLRKGDLVTKIGNKTISDSKALVSVVRAGKVGDTLQITIRRDGNEQQVTATLGES